MGAGGEFITATRTYTWNFSYVDFCYLAQNCNPIISEFYNVYRLQTRTLVLLYRTDFSRTSFPDSLVKIVWWINKKGIKFFPHSLHDFLKMSSFWWGKVFYPTVTKSLLWSHLIVVSMSEPYNFEWVLDIFSPIFFLWQYVSV